MNSHTKICFVQPVQAPYWSERLKILAQEKDFELSFLLERATFDHRPGWKPQDINGIRIEVLNSMVVSSTSKGDDLGYRIQGIRSIAWRLVPALFRIKPHVVVVCNATQLLLSLPSKLLNGVRIALIVEDTPHATRNLSWISNLIKSWAYKRADMRFAFSEDAIQFLFSIGIKNRVKRSSWSVEMGSLKMLPLDSKQFNKTEGRPVKTLLFVGQLVPRKGIIQLIEAWRFLPYEYRKKAQLFVAGDGPLHDQLSDFVEENNLEEVKMLGQVPYERVLEFMGNSDLFILPTLEDLFSLTVLEAMGCSCAVVTTPFNGARELIQDGENGWIVDPTQRGALTTVLERALSDETDLNHMGQLARKRVENMDNRIVMSKFAQNLRELAES